MNTLVDRNLERNGVFLHARQRQAERAGLLPQHASIEVARADYRRLRDVWPWSLPPGYDLPSESLRLANIPGPNIPSWYNPLLEIYELWRGALAVAAYAAHLRHESSTAERLLCLIKDTYDSELRRACIDDPGRQYVLDAIHPAFEGDFSVLIQTDINHFLSNEQLASVARCAGDF